MLFALDPERTHEWTLSVLMRSQRWSGLLSGLRKRYDYRHPALAVSLWDHQFHNPVGLAAGFDKDARAVQGLAALGFGFIEVGTITPEPQPGNPRPRMFRLPADRALINRLGFNNRGAKAAAKRLARFVSPPVPLGINIGRNRWTPNENALDDYRRCLCALYPYAAYFVVNISSPNTPDLRELQRRQALSSLLAGLQTENLRLSHRHAIRPRPLLIKIDPDLDDRHLRDIVAVALDHGVAGVVATNTTVTRDGLTDANAAEVGGLSGAPLAGRSLRTIAQIYRLTGGRLPIIGVGGIMSAADAYARIRAGASLIQIYTGLVYEGPELVREINTRLVQLLQRDGLQRIADAVGVDAQTAAAAPRS